MTLKYADYVVTKLVWADLGAENSLTSEKLYIAGLKPSAVVLVQYIHSLKDAWWVT